MDVKTVNVIVKTNRQQFSMVCNLIHHRNDSLRSKRFQSSYYVKVRAEAKKKVEGGGEKRKRLPSNPTILENAP